MLSQHSLAKEDGNGIQSNFLPPTHSVTKQPLPVFSICCDDIKKMWGRPFPLGGFNSLTEMNQAGEMGCLICVTNLQPKLLVLKILCPCLWHTELQSEASLVKKQGKSVKELWRKICMVLDFTMRTTLCTNQATGRVMGLTVVAQRHFWLNLSNILDKD